MDNRVVRRCVSSPPAKEWSWKKRLILSDPIDEDGAIIDSIKLKGRSTRNSYQDSARRIFRNRHPHRRGCDDKLLTLRQIKGSGPVVVDQSTGLDLNESTGESGNAQSDGRIDFLIAISSGLIIDAVIIKIGRTVPVHLDIPLPQLMMMTPVNKAVPVAGSAKIDVYIPMAKAVTSAPVAVMFLHRPFDDVSAGITNSAMVWAISHDISLGWLRVGRWWPGGSRTGSGTRVAARLPMRWLLARSTQRKQGSRFNAHDQDGHANWEQNSKCVHGL